jgi:hypothetical protein
MGKGIHFIEKWKKRDCEKGGKKRTGQCFLGSQAAAFQGRHL